MAEFKRENIEGYTFVHRGGIPDIRSFVQKISNPYRRLLQGRGAPGLIEVNEEEFVCRQYLHGGWLRGITGKFFISERRAANELEITVYLEKNNFPVVRAVGYMARRSSLIELFFITRFVKDARDMVEYFRSSKSRDRLKMARRLAVYFFELGKIGIYHPDLHLRNILINTAKEVFFLDFDKSIRKTVNIDDYEKMFWRLDRYVRKYEADFGTPVTDTERLIFLRTFERMSGRKIIDRLTKNRGKKQRSAKAGWFVDRIFYKRNK